MLRVYAREHYYNIAYKYKNQIHYEKFKLFIKSLWAGKSLTE